MRPKPTILTLHQASVLRPVFVLILVGVLRAEALAQTTFTYDNNGNLLTRTAGGLTTEYLYDTRNLLAEVRQGSQVLARFAYDSGGRLIQKIGNDGIRQYAYDGPRVLAEYDHNGALIARFRYAGEDLTSVTWVIEGRRWVSTDGLGSVTALTDDRGVAVASYHFDAWGRFRFLEELGASRNRFGFTGYRFDDEVGNYNARARRYDPDLGRFTTQDTYLGKVEEPPTTNRYAYASANPTRYTDPTGQYQADVHYGLTKALALKAGFSEQVAEAIARGTEAPDLPHDPRNPIGSGMTVGRPDWMTRSKEAQKEKRQAAQSLREWHFPIDPGKKEVQPGSDAARKKFKEAAKSGNPIVIGESLHPFEDSWSHRGEPSLNGIAGHPKARGDWFSMAADLTVQYPNDARAMAKETYGLLVGLGEANPALRAEDPVEFGQFEDNIDRFILADSKAEKREALKTLGVEMPEEFWKDVSLRERHATAEEIEQIERGQVKK